MLDKRKIDIKAERSSRKEPLSDKEVRALLKSVNKVIIAKGRKSSELAASRTKPVDLKGPTGNYRAPMVRKGKTLLVGFNQDALDELL